MRTKLFLFFIPVFFFLLIGETKAQNTRQSENTPFVPAPRYQAVKKEKKGFFARLFSKEEKTDKEVFRSRMKKLYRAKAKEERKADKPQYTNPLYFGHKKPPKKRPLGKRKYCEECGIRH